MGLMKKIKISDHEYYEGETRDEDIPHGQGTLTDEKKKTKHKGGFKDGYRHGLATVYIIDKSGHEIKFTGVFDKDKGLPDYGLWELPNGEIYQGELKNLDYHGKGKYRHSSGIIQEGVYEKGKIKKLIKEYNFSDFTKKYLKLFLKESQPKLKNDGEWVFVNNPSNKYVKLVREDYFIKDFIREIIHSNCKNLLFLLKKTNIEYDYKYNRNQTTNIKRKNLKMKIEKIQIKDGEIYFGHLKNGKPHGKGYVKYGELGGNSPRIGSTFKKGIFKDGYLIKGTIHNSSSTFFEGKLSNKEKIVKGKLKYLLGNNKIFQVYTGGIKKHKKYGYVPHGENGKLTNPNNGDKSIGKFEDGFLIKGKINWGSNKKKWEKYPT